MEKPVSGPQTAMRCAARTQSLEEANQIAERYMSEGFETEIIKKRQSGLTLYEVWVGKTPDVFCAAAGQGNP